MAQDKTLDPFGNPIDSQASQPKPKSPFSPTAAWDAGPAAASGASMAPSAGQDAFDQAAAKKTGAAAPSTAPTAPTGPSGIDPSLWSIYQKSGVTPGERGTGFADWQYWQDVGPSQYGRLTADLAGTGTDQPTGTPGSGAWMNSGKGQPEAGPSSASSSFTSSVSPQNSALHDQLLKMLTARATQGLNVDPNDPVIAAQTNAASATQNRQMRQYLSGVAEQKGPYGNVGAETRSANESVGQNVSAIQASLMGSELTAKRAEIQSALSGMQGMLTNDEQMKLQADLAQMDDQIRRLQLQQQGSQFSQQLGSQNGQFAANYGLDADAQAWRQDRINRGLPV